MKTWQSMLLGIFFGLLATGVILLVGMSPRGKPIELLPLPTPGPIIVYVTGAVANPGVYTLPQHSRVADAIQAAGGLASLAAPEGINQAARAFDGQHILVPTTEEFITASLSQSISAQRPIDLNSATQVELEKLPGIGPAKAKDIIDYRDAHGPFHEIEDLEQVAGIGSALIEKIRDYIILDTTP